MDRERAELLFYNFLKKRALEDPLGIEARLFEAFYE